MAFGELIRLGHLVRSDSRRFEAQTWEPDLVKALDLPKGTRLERRSGTYRVPGFGNALVRVDSIVVPGSQFPAPSSSKASPASKENTSGRSTLQPTSAAVAPSTAPPSAATGSQEPATGNQGTEPPVWQNAMLADRLMVQAEQGITQDRLQRALPRGCRVSKAITTRGLYSVEVPSEGERSIERAVLALNQLKGVVQFAEPDFLTSGADTTPNDPLVGPSTTTQQWHLGKIMAPRAWDVITAPKTQADANSTAVAIVDTGVDYTHPDLAPNMWTNTGETGGGKETNGIDDDGNGKVDDHRGWDFIGQSTVKTTIQPDNDPMDDSGHGTHVAGIIGGVGNNSLGITGVCWGVKLLPLRIIKKFGSATYGTYSAAIGALDYIRQLNSPVRRVAVANHSWGGSGYSLAMLNAINNPLATTDPLPVNVRSTYAKNLNVLTATGTGVELAKIKVGMTISGTGIPASTVVTIVSGSSVTLSNYTTLAGSNALLGFSNPVRPKPYGVVHVAAAGNSRFNNDRVPTYPASIPSGFLVSVGASDASDAVSLWAGAAGSNFGKLTVDLFAPGTGIWSTKLKLATDTSYTYESCNGTSMAAPQVSGALALLRLWQPNLTDLQARQILIDQVEPVSSLKDKCASGGRLNLAKVVDKLYQPVLVSSGGGTGGSGTTAQLLTNSMALVGRIAVLNDSNTMSASVLAIDEGDVYAWGYNFYGNLGVGDYDDRSKPTKITNLSNVIQLAGGAQFALALDANGHVWAWGANGSGQLGLGTTSFRQATPVQVPGLDNVVWISAGLDFSIVVKADGTVWGWGANQNGQLAFTDTSEQHSPVQSPYLSDVLQVEAGREHVVALKSDSTVWCWGYRGFFGEGSLGDGLTSGYTRNPVQAQGLSGIVMVEAGRSSSYAITNSGIVYEWGLLAGNLSGNPYSAVPTLKSGLSGVVALSGNGMNTLGVDYEGRLWFWGVTEYGASGLGTEDNRQIATPVQVSMVDSTSMVACAGGRNFFIVRTCDGDFYTFGSNDSGQLGIGRFANKKLPVRLSQMQGALDVSVGRGGAYALDAGGTDFSWGYSGFRFPHPSGVISGAAQLIQGEAAENGFFLALKQDGTVWSWGASPGGQLGLGNTSSRSSPAQITSIVNPRSLSATQTANFRNGTQGHVFAVLSDGTVKAWGANAYGQLGVTGAGAFVSSPATVAGLANIVSAIASDTHSLALTATGEVYAWGHNHYGQLGDGTLTDRSAPQLISGLNGVVQIAAVGNHSFALKSDGSVWAWGQNEATYLKVSPSQGTKQRIPARVQGLPSVSKVVVGAFAFYAFTNDQRLWSWGNTMFSLDGHDPASTKSSSTPAPVVGIAAPVKLSSHYSTLVTTADGATWSWGIGSDGAVGDGDAWSSKPVKVIGLGAASSVLSTLGTGSTADSWLLGNFSVGELVTESLISDAADPDKDGIPNLLEYALGLNPRALTSSGLPTARTDLIGASAQSESTDSQIQLFSTPTVDLSSGKRYLAYTVDRSSGIRQDIDYIVEVSNDLINWNSGDPYTVTVLDTAETLEVYSATSLDDVPRQFMRLKIQRK